MDGLIRERKNIRITNKRGEVREYKIIEKNNFFTLVDIKQDKPVFKSERMTDLLTGLDSLCAQYGIVWNYCEKEPSPKYKVGDQVTIKGGDGKAHRIIEIISNNPAKYQLDQLPHNFKEEELQEVK